MILVTHEFGAILFYILESHIFIFRLEPLKQLICCVIRMCLVTSALYQRQFIQRWPTTPECKQSVIFGFIRKTS